MGSWLGHTSGRPTERIGEILGIETYTFTVSTWCKDLTQHCSHTKHSAEHLLPAPHPLCRASIPPRGRHAPSPQSTAASFPGICLGRAQPQSSWQREENGSGLGLSSPSLTVSFTQESWRRAVNRDSDFLQTSNPPWTEQVC